MPLTKDTWFNVRLTEAGTGFVAYLSHRDRTKWRFRTAIRHAQDMLKMHPGRFSNIDVIPE